MIRVILGPTLFQGLGLEDLKGQLLIIPNALTSLHFFGAISNNVSSSLEKFKRMAPFTIILKTTSNCLL